MSAAAAAVKPHGARLARAPAKDMPKAASAPAVPRFLRRRLTVGSEHDPAEHHAERVAATVASGQNAHRVLDAGASHPNAPMDVIHRACGCGDGTHQVRDPGALWRASGGAFAPSHEAADLVDATLSQPGRPMAPGMRATLEGRMGAPLDHVRMYDGPTAQASAAALGARAYALGSNIVLGQGQSEHDTHLMAHEATHVVQNDRAGSRAMARRDALSQTIEDCHAMRAVNPCDANRLRLALDKTQKPPPTTKVKALSDGLVDPKWEIDLTAKVPRIRVPQLPLPMIDGTLKGTGGPNAPAAANNGGPLPQKGKLYRRQPQASRQERKLEAARDVWIEDIKKSSATFASGLTNQIKAQKNVPGLVNTSGDPVYVLSRAGTKGDLQATSSEFLVVGTVSELANNDSVLRPMMTQKGAAMPVDVDHILEDQLGGANTIDNMWLLDRDYNRSIGSRIQNRTREQIENVIANANATITAQANQGVVFDGTLPSVEEARQNWLIEFAEVIDGQYGIKPKDHWVPQDIRIGRHLRYYRALTDKELFEQGFKFDKDHKLTHINIFPTAEGGRPTSFKLDKDGKFNLTHTPAYLFRGIEVCSVAEYNPPDPAKPNSRIAVLNVQYKKKKFPGTKKKDLVKAEGPVTIMHAPNLFFGGYVTRDSITSTFKDSDFGPASPISFSAVEISADGELQAVGDILSSKALLPGLHMPLMLQGNDVFLRFPLPADKLNFGPVHVTAAAIDIGVGDKGFFIQGSADIAIDKVGTGKVVARGENDNITFTGEFDLALDFLDQTKVKVTYDLATDTFTGSAEFKVKKKIFPGVEGGSVKVDVSRDSFGLVGSLELGGILAGGTITAGYTPETGLVLEGKNIPLPVEKAPGVTDAKVTVRAVRNPETGEWRISGGGKAGLSAGGASAMLEIAVDGLGVFFRGRADVKKDPASGWLQVIATNQTVDDAGNPVEGGPIGDLKIWGKGEATVRFGKVLHGTAGIEYTPDGRVILDGEVAVDSDFELFPQLSYHKRLLHLAPPDFPIWGIELGPVEVGLFAFVDASVDFNACIGQGVLKDTKAHATIDLDHPEDATVIGTAKFYIPAFAGFTLDLGGGLKASLAIAYAKGRIGLDGTLGIKADAELDVAVKWNRADGFAVGGCAKATASPQFSLGVNANFTVGVDLGLFDIDHDFGPWHHTLGEFGPNMSLRAAMPIQWSEKDGLDFDVDKIDVKKPEIDVADMMVDAFKTLV
jgi:hypothetical protein